MPKDDQRFPESDDELKELIELALKQNIEVKKEFKSREALAKRLSSILSEYLDSYILLGYDFTGNHIDIKAAPTPQQVEALNSFLLRYFASEVQYIKGAGGASPGPNEIF
jgi:hypothetical protein